MKLPHLSITLTFFVIGVVGCTGNQSNEKETQKKSDSISVPCDTITYSGIYNDKNLFFQNEYSKAGESCIKKIEINGQITTGEINSSAFEIDFKKFNLIKGAKVVVKIIHNNGCSFKCLNEKALLNLEIKDQETQYQ